MQRVLITVLVDNSQNSHRFIQEHQATPYHYAPFALLCEKCTFKIHRIAKSAAVTTYHDNIATAIYNDNLTVERMHLLDSALLLGQLKRYERDRKTTITIKGNKFHLDRKWWVVSAKQRLQPNACIRHNREHLCATITAPRITV